MRPTPIPDDAWDHELATRSVLTGPVGHEEEIPAVEALVYMTEMHDGAQTPAYATRWILEDGDLEKLAKGVPIWLHVMTAALPPVEMTISEGFPPTQPGDE